MSGTKKDEWVLKQIYIKNSNNCLLIKKYKYFIKNNNNW